MKFQSKYDTPVTLFINAEAIRFDAYGEYETDDPGVIAALKNSAEVTRVREAKPEPKPEPTPEPEPKVESTPEPAPAVLEVKREHTIRDKQLKPESKPATSSDKKASPRRKG